MATDGIALSRSKAPDNDPNQSVKLMSVRNAHLEHPYGSETDEQSVSPRSHLVSSGESLVKDEGHSRERSQSPSGRKAHRSAEKKRAGSSQAPIADVRARKRAPKRVESRNSFFSLLSQYKPTATGISDQRSPGPLVGQQYQSPGDMMEDEDVSPPSSSGGSLSGSGQRQNRNSPLHWLAKMGVANRDGNAVIRPLKRPSVSDGTASAAASSSAASSAAATRDESPKRGKAKKSESSKKIKSNTIDKAELDRLRKRSIAHFDTQSMAFNLQELVNQGKVPDTKHQKVTGASAAARGTTGDIFDDVDRGDGVGNEIVASCPFFRNEIGNQSVGPSLVAQAAQHRRVRVSMSAHETIMEANRGGDVEMNGNADDEGRGEESESGQFEFIDQGAVYYRKHFYGQDHQNYAGNDENLGPIAVSLRREPMPSSSSMATESSSKDKYQYRFIIRTSDLLVMRGSIPEDSILTTTKPGNRGLPAKDVLEFVACELQLSCLRLTQTGKVPERLLQLDEEGLSSRYRIGVMYCKEGQKTEDEMYGNETGSPAFDRFLTVLGEKVTLKGFQSYRAQLDTKGDSTGTHSIFTSFHSKDIMFHVSTLLPYTPNNDQQVLRKRHIGNDIVTIVFQESGSEPFSPKMVRSNFQHIFLVVRLLPSSSTGRPYYGIAVSRSMSIPLFGPEIPSGATFLHGSGFREFLLTKALNGESAAKKSAKFADMAKRTRKEYLLDLAKSYATNQTLDSAFGLYGKLFSRAVRRRDKNKPYLTLETAVKGAITWHVQVEGFVFRMNQQNISCVLGISVDSIVLVDESTKQTIFSIPSKTVIGWTPKEYSLKLYYNVGEFVMIKLPRDGSDPSDVQEIVKRLSAVTSGCEALEMKLQKMAASGQLGFIIHDQGLIGEVDELSYVSESGLRKGSRIVEVGDMPVHDMNYDNLVQLLKIAGSVQVIVIPPSVDGQARGTRMRRQHSWTSLYTPSATPELAEEEEQRPNGVAQQLAKKAKQWSRPASADCIRKSRLKSRSAGSVTESSSWYKDSSSVSSVNESDTSEREEESEEEEGGGEDEEEEERESGQEDARRQALSSSSTRGALLSASTLTTAFNEDEVESSDAEADFNIRIGDIVETANRLADQEEARKLAESLAPEQREPEKSVVSSTTLPTPTRPRVKSFDTVGVGRRNESIPRIEDGNHQPTDSHAPPYPGHRLSEELQMKEKERDVESAEVTSLEEALKKIGCLEDRIEKLTKDLFEAQSENAHLTKDLEMERFDNASLRLEARNAASELRRFTSWYYEQQMMTSDL
eukprot:m.1921 g.1921  ORF g.1921 m.1921 type:complete len:1288 (+) comp8060_c0_seq1:132-3995(+)